MTDNIHQCQQIISETSNYIVVKGTFMKLAKLRTQRQVQLGKTTVEVAGLIGKPVGSQFKLLPRNGKSRLFDAQLVDRVEDMASNIVSDQNADDNRNLLAHSNSQRLSTSDIMEMRDQGLAGKQIVSSIVENSRSFDSKTEYSQEKYVRKKQRKYFEFISVQWPSLRLLAKMYYMQDPLKILNLRVDSLAQLLSACNVRAGGRYVVFESGCLGLTVAALLERIGDQGRIVHVYQGGNPQRHAIDAMNFSRDQLNCLSCVNILRLAAEGTSSNGGEEAALSNGGEAAALSNAGEAAAPSNAGEAAAPSNAGEAAAPSNAGEAAAPSNAGEAGPRELPAVGGQPVDAVSQPKSEGATEEEAAGGKRKLQDSTTEHDSRKRPKYSGNSEGEPELSLEALARRDMDGLLVCCRHHPLNILLYLIEFLAVSRPFAVFCPYKEPLLECYFKMKTKGCVMMKVTETWLREYQVLPERTHPQINMSGGGGYLLTGYKVDRSLDASDVDT